MVGAGVPERPAPAVAGVGLERGEPDPVCRMAITGARPNIFTNHQEYPK